jgi:hypothetical protein
MANPSCLFGQFVGRLLCVVKFSTFVLNSFQVDELQYYHVIVLVNEGRKLSAGVAGVKDYQ